LCCPKLRNLLKFGPMVLQVGDNLFVLRSGAKGLVFHPFSSFVICGSCTYFGRSLALVLMPTHQRMMRRRGGGGNIGFKHIQPFPYGSVGTFFDVVTLTVRR